jgi:peptidylprolyl isomerase
MQILRAVALVFLIALAVSAQTSNPQASDSQTSPPQTSAAQASPSKGGSPQIPAPADVAAPPANADRTKDGLATTVLKPGSGKTHPGKDEVVTVDYTAWTTNGKMFDSTLVHGKPLTITMDHMLPGMAEGLRMMTVGEKRRMWVPESLAFNGAAGKPAGPLVFDVTLLELPTRAPADVRTPPADALRTKGNISYKVLHPGTGTRHPTKTDTVLVNYTGWTTDGKMFDSSWTHGAPAPLALQNTIKGWQDGVPLMVEGEKTRFWIPERVAYEGSAKPYGMLVFDIELVKIE